MFQFQFQYVSKFKQTPEYTIKLLRTLNFHA
jgi:hypothetical protein